MRFKGTMTTLSSNVDATTNLETILATGRYHDGPPGRNREWGTNVKRKSGKG